MINRQLSLSRNLVQFCRFLRQNGFTLGAEEEATALKSLPYIDYNTQSIFRLALKAVLCRSQKQLTDFDTLFNAYWQEFDKAFDSKIKTKAAVTSRPGADEAAFKSLKAWLNGNKSEETERTAAYGIQQNLAKQDFSTVPAEDLPEIMRTIKALARRLATQRNKRYQKSEKISLPDLRKTLRKNMRHGGELIELAFRKVKRNRLKLVILFDVSKSMELYTVFLLQFLYSFGQVYSRLEAFAFSTSLQCITPHLKHPDFTSALQKLSAQNNSWSGGTKIGESLHTFVTAYAPRLLNKHTITLILSDGWDTGEIPLLGQSMAVIKARSKKVIWLNPLAGYAGYRPEVAGMQAALPYIDVLAPVHNVDSLRKLAKWL